MFRALDKWLMGYVKSAAGRQRHVPGLKHLFFCLADHFEPFRGGASKAEAVSFVREWTEGYARAVQGIRDADGRGPRHTFFYPAEDYDADVLDILAGLCGDGTGEVEIHLHHRNDTAEGLREKLESFKNTLHQRHGLLGRDAAGRVRYGFVHGNWALCNSRPDGDWCGVNEELSVLQATGCYADFTFPSAPSPTQPRMVNALYRAWDRQGMPRGADTGVAVKTVGLRPRTLNPSEAQSAVCGLQSKVSSSLMLITGPLALNWSRRKWGVLPRLENAEISGANVPSAERIRLWSRQWIHVEGKPEWVFVKVHTHGGVEANRRVILGGAMREAHAALHRDFNDGREWRLHYVTAREMYNLARAAEAGAAGQPDLHRDFEIGPPVAGN